MDRFCPRLYFKASPSGFAVVCSQDKTFRLKRKNHSNTVLLGSHNAKKFINSKFDVACEQTLLNETPKLVTFASLHSDFECSLSNGTIDLDQLPVYQRGTISSFVKSLENETAYTIISVHDLKISSAISDTEFNEMFALLKGTEINEIACILSDQIVTYCLNFIILTLQSRDYKEMMNKNNIFLKENDNQSSQDLDEDEQIYQNIDSTVLDSITIKSNPDRLNKEILNTILFKFSIIDGACHQHSDKQKYTLDSKKIAIWYGIESLKKYAKNASISINEFLIKWKQAFPALYDVPVEFCWLNGHFYRPLGYRDEKVQWMDTKMLSSDIVSRFKELFKLQLMWDINEMEPFIEDLNVKNLKLDKFVLRYARKKMDGKRVVVTSR